MFFLQMKTFFLHVFTQLHTCPHNKHRYILLGLPNTPRNLFPNYQHLFNHWSIPAFKSYCDTSHSSDNVFQTWFLKNQKVRKYIESRSLSSCNSIKTCDFSPLDNIFHTQKTKGQLKELIQLLFHKIKLPTQIQIVLLRKGQILFYLLFSFIRFFFFFFFNIAPLTCAFELTSSNSYFNSYCKHLSLRSTLSKYLENLDYLLCTHKSTFIDLHQFSPREMDQSI